MQYIFVSSSLDIAQRIPINLLLLTPNILIGRGAAFQEYREATQGDAGQGPRTTTWLLDVDETRANVSRALTLVRVFLQSCVLSFVLDF